MAENSKIEWTDHTFNPWIGCTKVSPACDHCYAEAWAKRSGLVEWGAHAPRRRTSATNWRKPLTWNDRACWFVRCNECGWRGESKGAICGNCASVETTPARPRVFCASLADVFDNAVDPQWRVDLWQLIQDTPNLDWLLLTKRVGNVFGMLPDGWAFQNAPWPHVWIGATVVNQEEADRDIPKLLSVPAAKRFLSMEPLLAPVKLRWEWVGRGRPIGGGPSVNIMRPWEEPEELPAIDWVIVGGESGPGARPMHPDWARSIRDQCVAAGVPFFFKQWGEWTPGENAGDVSSGYRDNATWWDETWLIGTTNMADPEADWDDEPDLYRIGKKAAGRLLDDRTWDEAPA